MIVPGSLRLLDATLPDAVDNVALDEHLLRATEETDAPGILRIWELASYAVVMGRGNRVDRNVHVDACRVDGVPIIRRSSGGGTVLLGPGSLVYSLILRIDTGSRLANIDGTTREIMQRIRRALVGHSSDITQEGHSDLTRSALKFSGNSQRWLRRTMLHHGTILYDFDLDRISRYLTAPERSPDYRQGRTHAQFVANLPLSRAAIYNAIVTEWEASHPMTLPDQQPIQELVHEIFGSDAWTFKH